jgi:GNAT superfamily N-acetyltransferase
LATTQEPHGDGHDAPAGVRFGYQLVICAGRSPIGYCTFAFIVEDLRPDGGPLIELDVLETWVAPAHRGLGAGAALAQVVARLAAEGVLELESRLGHYDAEVQFEFRVSGEVYSASGAAFLRATADFLREQVDELAELFAGGLQRVLFDEIALDVR